MNNVVIFEDGKSGRGSRAKLIKRGNKRVLIEFTTYDYDLGEDVLVTEWFKVFNPSWNKNSLNKRNNKRKSASYYHEESNEFYRDDQQTDPYKSEMKKYLLTSYYEELYGAGVTHAN